MNGVCTEHETTTETNTENAKVTQVAASSFTFSNIACEAGPLTNPIKWSFCLVLTFMSHFQTEISAGRHHFAVFILF